MRKLGVFSPVLVSVVLASTFAVAVVAAGAEPSAQAASSTPFAYTGAPDSFPVPAGICAVTVDAFGARGGSNSIASGGLGGEATARVAVTPGEVLQVRVGGHGGDGNSSTGGFNGGGTGGNGFGQTSSGDGGGGASDVRRAPYGTADRLVVAGGGGGAANSGGQGGGAGGGTTGGNGIATGAQGGRGATQSAVGDHGTGGDNGTAGVGAVGGDGGTASSGGNADGGAGGGGGGYFGGGGGNAGPGVNGGGPGGGGGGSGFTPTGTGLTSGVRDGHGQIVISYDPATDSCPSPAAALETTVRFTG